jgi:hypothetical protein
MPAGGAMTIPAGQSLLVRMIDGVDSSKNHVGDIFHASLETDLVINGGVVARKGTDVYGRLANAKEAGHMSGSSELQLELTRMVVNGQDYPVVSSDYTLKGKGRGGNTAEKVGGGAIAGAIIGAIAGGGKGAAIGAGASVHARPASEGAERDAAGIPAAAAGNHRGPVGTELALSWVFNLNLGFLGRKAGGCPPFAFLAALRPCCRLRRIRPKIGLAASTVSD